MDFRTLMIGGIIPSILLGLGSVLMKMSIRSGMSLPFYLCVVGLTVFVVGCGIAVYMGDQSINLKATGFAVFMGLGWSAAIFCMTYGYSVLGLPVSIVAPLTNSNAIIAVIASSILMSEWEYLNLYKVFGGTIFIVMGAAIVSTALQK